VGRAAKLPPTVLQTLRLALDRRQNVQWGSPLRSISSRARTLLRAASVGTKSRILCATDFSQAADGALAWAARLAEPRGAELHLVHALVPAGKAPAAGGYLHEGALDEERAAAARGGLSARTAAFGVTSAELRRGELADEILKRAVELHADLLVIGVPPSEARTHALLGSVGERLIRSAQVPVLTVPLAGHAPAGEDRLLLRRILFPTDLSSESDRALGRFLATLGQFVSEETDVHLLHVLDMPAYVLRTGNLEEELERSVQHDLNELAARHRTGRLRLHVEMRHGRAAETIGERATALDVDLVAMPTHGRTGLARFFLGSVAEGVARAGVRPTMTFHPLALRGGEPTGAGGAHGEEYEEQA
jgi:nucleotide-binding universal stress UspA family protein